MNLFFSYALTEALGWTLLHSLWQSLVLAAVLLLVWKLSPTAARRYQVGLGSLLAQLVLSLGTFSWYYQKAHYVATLMHSIPSLQPIEKGTSPTWQTTLYAYFPLMIQVWFMGIALFLGRLAVNYWYADQLKYQRTQPVSSAVEELFQKLLYHLPIPYPVTLLESAKVTVPMVIGYLKPVILLPIGLATRLTTQQLEAILAHEIAHLMRNDFVINLIQSTMEALYFFNPTIWWISNRIRDERENACDDVAIALCGNKRALAQALAQVESYRQEPVLAMAFGARKMPLLQRIQRILGIQSRTTPYQPISAWLLLGLLLMVGSAMAIQQQAKPKTPTQEKPQTSASPKKTKNRLSNLNRLPSEKEWEYASKLGNRHYISGKGHFFVDGKDLYNELDSAQKIQIDQHAKALRELEEKMQPYQSQLHTLEQQLHAQSEQMRRYEVPLREQEHKMRALEEQYRPKMRELEQLERQLQKAQNEKQRELLEKQIEANEKHLEAFHRESEKIEQQMKLVSEQMDAFSTPMDSLSRQMDAITETQMEALAKQMEEHAQAISRIYGEDVPPPPPPLPRRGYRLPPPPPPARPSRVQQMVPPPPPPPDPVAPKKPREEE
ncbi:MAG: M56 family metallopeptidase [Spirosomataceae bacterium]